MSRQHYNAIRQARRSILLEYVVSSYSFLVRGRPFDSEGGGVAGKFCRDGSFIFSMSLAGKFIFRYTKARIFIFTCNKFLKPKKKTPDGGGWGGGSECWFRREIGQEFQCDFLFHF